MVGYESLVIRNWIWTNFEHIPLFASGIAATAGGSRHEENNWKWRSDVHVEADDMFVHSPLRSEDWAGV